MNKKVFTLEDIVGTEFTCSGTPFVVESVRANDTLWFVQNPNGKNRGAPYSWGSLKDFNGHVGSSFLITKEGTPNELYPIIDMRTANLKEEQLKTSEIYVGQYPDGKVIFKYGGGGLELRKHVIINKAGTYTKTPTSCCTSSYNRILRKPTLEEKQWFEACEQAGKAISLQELNSELYPIF